ncbi:MAG: hypothetical protein ACYCY0_11210 [Acidithiobacillus ferrivorans]
MKYSVLGKVGALLLIAGTAFVVPAYAESHTGQGRHEGSEMMGGKGEAGAQQMSELMNEMSSVMKDMSGMIESGSLSPATMKKMSSQMKQMGGMMNHMSGMMHKGMTMNAGTQKEMGQMRKQIEHMRKDMPASPAKM